MLRLCLGYFIHLCNARLLYMCWDIGVILASRADPINIRLSWRCRRRRRHSGTSDLNIYSALPHTLRAQTAYVQSWKYMFIIRTIRQLRLDIVDFVSSMMDVNNQGPPSYYCCFPAKICQILVGSIYCNAEVCCQLLQVLSD